MSEELIQRNLVEAPEKMGDWNFYNIGATIPVKPDGSFDLDAQKSLAESLLCLRQTRKTIFERMSQLISQKIEF